MMKKIYYLICLVISSISFAKAQDAADILRKCLNKANAIKTLSYEVKNVDKNFFTDDTTNSRWQSVLDFSDTGNIKIINREFSKNNNYKEFYLNDTSYIFDFSDGTYTKHATLIRYIANDFLDVKARLEFLLHKKNAKFIQEKDTVIDNIDCYNIFAKSYDTIVNNEHNFGYTYFYIDKQNLLTIYYKDIGEGAATKGGKSIGRISNFSQKHFYNYVVDKPLDNSIFSINTNQYRLPNNKMLSVGTKAPSLILKNLLDKNVDSSLFQNKILLVEFGSTECPANPLANPLLNRLFQKYDEKDVLIFCVYNYETAEQAKKYIQSQHIQFPVYLGNANLKKNYHAFATPSFYVINKDEKIVRGDDGYYDDLEKDLTTTINSLLNKK
ncbi:TlpA family protein disulfide reductase [Arachidicoccus ginsenosidimutans]|uniref:TlpA family protein disulfide reductase n=1 Tax=Arachidicoccus sp. BS20 TaxID=1850526 RepID=UPI0018D363C9|nr:TlpA disulfide reductase family protein [Arachidicoccus sp. BS20]